MTEQNAAPGITVGTSRACGAVRLTEPVSSRGLDRTSAAAMRAAYAKWAKDPRIYGTCVTSGASSFYTDSAPRVADIGDVGDPTGECQTLKDLYALIWQLEVFTKPNVALIDGAVSGLGVGISAFGTHQVAGQGYRFSLAAAGPIGFPHGGACWRMARLADSTGMYLALTGRQIKRADGYRLGLVTHTISATGFACITAALEEADPIDPVLDGLNEAVGPPPIDRFRDVIGHCFEADSVEEIGERLGAVQGADRDWAQAVLAELSAKPAISLKITHRAIQEARSVDLNAALAADYWIACRFLTDEATRRASIEGIDAHPQHNGLRWQLAAVSGRVLEDYFAPHAADDFTLAARPRSPSVLT